MSQQIISWASRLVVCAGVRECRACVSDCRCNTLHASSGVRVCVHRCNGGWPTVAAPVSRSAPRPCVGSAPATQATVGRHEAGNTVPPRPQPTWSCSFSRSSSSRNWASATKPSSPPSSATALAASMVTPGVCASALDVAGAAVSSETSETVDHALRVMKMLVKWRWWS